MGNIKHGAWHNYWETLIRKLSLSRSWKTRSDNQKSRGKQKEHAHHSILMNPIYYVSNVALTFAYLLSLNLHHHVQYIFPPQGSALALRHQCIPLLTYSSAHPPPPQPNVDSIHLPLSYLKYIIHFAASRSAELETRRHCRREAAAAD